MIILGGGVKQEMTLYNKEGRGIRQKVIFMTKEVGEVHTQPRGQPPSADLRYGVKDSISPTTQMCAATKG